MAEQRQFQVVSECAYVTVDTAAGPQKTLLYKGGVFGADAPECQHLLDNGLAVPFGHGGSVGLNAYGEIGPGGAAKAAVDVKVKPAGRKPSPGDSKDAWVDYAVSQGMDRAEVEKSSKQDLVDALK